MKLTFTKIIAKMMCVKVLCVLIPLLSFVSANSPVIMWESTSPEGVTDAKSPAALVRLSNTDFERYLLKKINVQPLPMVGMFIDPTLSIEDLSWQDSNGEGHFVKLDKTTQVSQHVDFLLSVKGAVEAVERVAKKLSFKSLNFDQNDVGMVDDGCGMILNVKLREPKSDEDRAQLLRSHDSVISDTYSKLLSKCSHVIGIYAGMGSSWIVKEEVRRMRREIDNANSTISSSPEPSNIPSSVTPDGKVLYSEGQGLAMVFSDSFPKLRVDKEETILGDTKAVIVSADSSKIGNIKLVVRYNDNKKILNFNFDNSTWYGYWNLKSVTLENTDSKSGDLILKPSVAIYAPIGQSFHSGTSVKFVNGTTVLEFSRMQLQPFFTNKGSKSFGDAVDAVTFFTQAIWSGIFVTFLLALIFTWGITMIMDIRTMDQFDDPKGKTITVSNTD